MIGFGHIAEPDFYTHFPAMLPRSSRPRAAWGTGVYPSKQYFDIKMRCLRQRRHRRRWYLKGADNTPYEKIGDEVRSLADEVPFDIPDSWEWVRLGNIGDWGAGATPSRTNPEYYGGNIPWLKTGDLTDSYIDAIPETITELALEKTSVRLNPAGSVLIAMYGATIGKLGILSIAATTNQACCACFPLGGLDNKYLFYFLMAQKPLFIKQGEGGAQPNISKEKIVSTLMPVPPLEEQRRIVVMLGQIFPIIDAYSKCKTELDLCNATFPERLKKSILQEAVQGKLVPQDPSDEPAEALLERIRTEKQRLIKEGKIKKDKHESVIFRRDNSHYEKRGSEEVCIDDEIPFEIPENWAWCRASSLGTMNRGRGIKRTETVAQGCPCIRYGEIYTTYETSFDSAVSFVPDTLDKDCLHFSSGDVVFTLTGENKVDIAKTVAFLGDGQIAAGGDLAFWTHHGMNPLYLVYYMASPYCIELKRRTATGDIIVHISTSKVGDFLVPVPPIKEQNRIVSAIEQLFAVASTL